MGSGIDIVVFSVMVLLFRMDEKIATPTSVILMALNSIAGILTQTFILHDFKVPVVHYWLAAIPIVIVGAPLGALLCDRLPRNLVFNILIALIGLELLSSLLIIEMTPNRLLFSVGALTFFLGLNYWMTSIQDYRDF